MKLDSLKTLYIHELNDLHSAEKQFVAVLPKLAKAASSEELRMAFEKHLQQSKEHAQTLEKVFSHLEEKPKRMTCKAMEGIVAEAEEMIEAQGSPAIKDAGLISAAQRAEHYEIAGYGCARTYAEWLGETESVKLLQETLDNERATDESLTELAERLIHAEPVHA